MNNPQVHHPSLNYGSISEQDEVQDSTWDEPDVPMEKTITRPKATRRYCLVGILIILGCLLVATLVGKVESRNQRVGWTKQEQSDTTTITTTTPPFQLCHLSGQKLNHFDPTCNITWTQPYFVSDQYFGGPGSPILVILGGEDPVNNILYPFVSERLAQEFQAYVIQTEHRFYGNSQPTRYMSTTNTTTSLNADEQVSNQDLNLYLSPEQAILDWIAIIRHVQLQLKCSLHNKTSPNYCPVITIGGSYPGFLSAMMRLNYPTVVDIAYASSAPLKLYEHAPDFDTNGYYKYVTKVAEEAFPGCAQGVRSTLAAVYDYVSQSTEDTSSSSSPKQMAKELDICTDEASFPTYITSNAILAQELTMLVVSSNADFNMAYYPPSNTSDLVQACQIFAANDNETTTAAAMRRYAKFLKFKQAGEDYQSAISNDIPNKGSDNHDDMLGTDSTCFNLQTEIPSGPNATLSSADWSGMGSGDTARIWEFQICRDLVVETGFGSDDNANTNTKKNPSGDSIMFVPPRPFNMTWLQDHCMARFQVQPQPQRLMSLWHFDASSLIKRASFILFTNGLHDGWAMASYTYNLSETIVAVNIPNGAHHSDLMHEWPFAEDTDDMIQARENIVSILRQWLLDLK